MAAAAGGTGEDPVSNNGPIAPGQSSEGVSTDAAAAADINRGRIICLKMFLCVDHTFYKNTTES